MKVYLIGGKARNGKDTLAEYMKEILEEKGQKVCIMHIASYLKDLIRNYFGWDGSEETKPRSLLQELGTDLIREKMGKQYYYTNRLNEDIEILSNYFDTFIVCDIRLPLEFTEIEKKYKDAIKIHITRENLETSLSIKEQKHITETALDSYDDYDIKIINTTLEDLKIQAKKIIEEVEI